ncbi:Thiol:disulfide interchange protein DsbA [invertebrate metagenome]|uniref:Thiol:disulfide interchange protein DsbA n=1 Tax=invertebrate metagenome TaxID=1711999 RepID=A0A2H9T534_9ZZZZ
MLSTTGSSMKRHFWHIPALALLMGTSFLSFYSNVSWGKTLPSDTSTSSLTQQTIFQPVKDYRVLKTPVTTSITTDHVDVRKIFWYGCPHCYSLDAIVDDWLKTLPNYVNFQRIPAFYSLPGEDNSKNNTAGGNKRKRVNLWKLHARLYYTVNKMVKDGNIKPSRKMVTGYHNQSAKNNRNEIEETGKLTSLDRKKHNADEQEILRKKLFERINDAIFYEVQENRNYLKDSQSMARFLSKKFGVNKKRFNDVFNSMPISMQLMQTSSVMKDYGLKGVPAIIIDGRYVVEPAKAGSLEKMTDIADFLIRKVYTEKHTEKDGKRREHS